MKKLIGGIICIVTGIVLKLTGSNLINIEVNGEKLAISNTLDMVLIGGLTVVGVLLIVSHFLSGKNR